MESESDSSTSASDDDLLPISQVYRHVKASSKPVYKTKQQTQLQQLSNARITNPIKRCKISGTSVVGASSSQDLSQSQTVSTNLEIPQTANVLQQNCKFHALNHYVLNSSNCFFLVYYTKKYVYGCSYSFLINADSCDGACMLKKNRTSKYVNNMWHSQGSMRMLSVWMYGCSYGMCMFWNCGCGCSLRMRMFIKLCVWMLIPHQVQWMLTHYECGCSCVCGCSSRVRMFMKYCGCSLVECGCSCYMDAHQEYGCSPGRANMDVHEVMRMLTRMFMCMWMLIKSMDVHLGG